MRTVRVYADTSVFGGVFDDEFAAASQALFDLVRLGRFSLLVSDVSAREIAEAPARVRQHFEALLVHMEIVPVDERVLELRDAYLAKGIVGVRWADDAAHVAAATVAGAELIVSWNFRHMVHYEKIRLYNAVNASQGYGSVDIRSPLEVIEYEEEEL